MKNAHFGMMVFGTLLALGCGGSEFASDATGGSAGAGGSAAAGATGGGGGAAGMAGNGATGGGATGGSAGSGATGGSAGSGATGGSAGSGATGGGAGGSVSVPEDCTNGIDDDGDGAVDCADQDCAPGYVCVPDPGLDSIGPLYTKERDAALAAVNCEPGLSALNGPRLRNLTSGTHQCTCRCGDPSGGSCGNADVLVSAGANCSVAAGSYPAGCHNIPSLTVASAEGTVDVLGLGTCTPVVDEVKEPAGWSIAVDRCAVQLTGKGCQDGVCVQRAPDSFYQGACVELSGDANCPAGYPLRTVYYESFADTRQCGSNTCGCEAPSGRHCGGTMRFFEEPSCPTGGAIRSYQMNGDCNATNLGSFAGSLEVVADQTPSGGTCSTTGSASKTGEVAPTSAHTICCVSN